MMTLFVWTWVALGLPSSPGSVSLTSLEFRAELLTTGQEQDTFEGHMLNTEGEVIEGKFTIQWKGSQAQRIRQILKTRRPTVKNVVLMVDREGRTRFPKTPSESDTEAYRSLAQGLCESVDAACFADVLVRWATHFPENPAGLAASVYAEALSAVPEHAAALAAVDLMPEADRLRIWRRTLEAHPKAQALAERVSRLFPTGVTPEKNFRPGEWLDLFGTMQGLDVRLVTDPDANSPGLIPAERKLGNYRHSLVWGRPDLIGFRSPHLFLVTPIRDAHAIRSCLQRGELVCNALEELFDGVKRRRELDGVTAGHDMLIVFLFESRAEYLRLGENLRNRGRDPGHADTAGFFSPNDRISRFYLPEEGYRYRRLESTLAHELTHHWLFASCPGFTNEEAIAAILTGRANLPGHWIVEGFASLMEELLYDDEAGTYATFNPRADHLDTIANSDPQQLVDWKTLYELTHTKVRELNRKPFTPDVLVPISWLEGYARKMTEWRYFYSQSAATCHYLFTGQDGELQQKLLEFVIAYYSGDASGIQVGTAFGMKGEDLGKRAWDYVQDWKEEAAEVRSR